MLRRTHEKVVSDLENLLEHARAQERVENISRKYTESLANRFFSDIITYAKSPPPANSDVVTVFIPKILRQIKGDEPYASFVADKAREVVYLAATRSK